MHSMEGEMLKGHLDMIVLAALSSGPAHGYAVIQEIQHRSGGAFELPEGTIYPALHRLEQAGLLSSHWTTAESGRQRRVYALTKRGTRALAAAAGTAERRNHRPRFGRALYRHEGPRGLVRSNAMGVERRYAAGGQGGARDRSDRLYPLFSARRRRLGLYQQPTRLTAVPRALSRAAQARLAARDGSGMSDGRLGHCGCRGDGASVPRRAASRLGLFYPG